MPPGSLDDASGVFLPKENTININSKVGRQWDKIYKRGDRIRDEIGAFTPGVGATDRNR